SRRGRAYARVPRASFPDNFCCGDRTFGNCRAADKPSSRARYFFALVACAPGLCRANRGNREKRCVVPVATSDATAVYGSRRGSVWQLFGVQRRSVGVKLSKLVKLDDGAAHHKAAPPVALWFLLRIRITVRNNLSLL